MKTETLEDLPEQPSEPSAIHPGLVVVHAAGRAQRLVLPLVGGELVLGRDELAAAGIPDGRVSRRHLRVEVDDDRWTVRDLGSRNGTFIDGEPLRSARGLLAPLVRIGRTLLLAVGDYRPHEALGITVREGLVMGPRLAAIHDRIRLIARSGATLLLSGESGTGKEVAAEVFHACRGDGALVVVNCATIQKELAERVLFGARRGAYTGAVSDAVGLIQAAHGGTLFLDEVAELEPGVQAKLLRVLETKRVTPLGAVSSVAVDVRLCAATHKDLRLEVAEGRFRGDLYFRIGRPEVRLPPLSERREEIPWLVERALASSTAVDTEVTASAELVEACMLRLWPGNLRELLAEAKMAALSAASKGRTCVAASDLEDQAGRAIEVAREVAAEVRPEVRADTPIPDAGAIEAALRAEQGNVARAAARLGMTRSRVRRFIERRGIDVGALRSG